ncbi:hypothetical protein B0H17DRAFT_1161618 [Mycena rosella]|uniref:Uncharacterized protein n=1 Tax=Mycena rosella TaxID=1033263 RepID=A0AAD7D2W9_MYCRO|nr:hypothetical protein B0H17DRAFT_1161618 [Mycena rosella]
MVSSLWKACSQGDLETVNQVLSTADSVDIEIKDHTGVTPLIEAVKNGHAEVVRALLDKGADPTNASSQGLPGSYTTDPTILGMLNYALSTRSQGPAPPHENGYDANDPNTYSHPPPGNYPYYPTISSAPPPEMYYPHPQMHMENNGPRHNNLPPPEVASAIPCRYFPACRYGTSCLFQHPQGPYFQGPLPPPAQYPTSYEQMPAQPYAPTYYPVSPPSFPPAMNGQHPMASHPQQGPPMPFQPEWRPRHALWSDFTHDVAHVFPPGQAPLPMSIPPLPPLHHQPPPPPAPQSPQAAYNPSSPPPAPHSSFVMQPSPAAQYPPVNGNGSSPQLNPQPDVMGLGRDGPGASRRGTARRVPPCIFFPTGRCKNGADCRFPHVMPTEGAPAHTPLYPPRGGGPRPRGHMNGNGNGFPAIDEKLANMSIQDNSRNPNGTDGRSLDPAARGRGGKPNFNAQANKRASMVKQRVPNADEFPVLAGSTTPPARSPGVNGSLPNGNGHAGPTAAQILQAPRPVRSNSSQAVASRGVTPERVKSKEAYGMQELKPEVNGTEVHASPKIPVSFASVATAGSDVSVAA